MPIPSHHAAAILAAFRNDPELRRWLAAVGLAYATGFRIGELFGLRWDDVDWKRGIIWMAQTLKRPGRNPVFGDTKNRVARPVPVSRRQRAGRAR